MEWKYPINAFICIYNYYSQNTVNIKVLFFEVSPIVISN